MVFFVVAGAIVSACSGDGQSGGRACPDFAITIGDVAELAYPEPQSTGVSDSFGTLVYMDDTATPIRIQKGGTLIATAPTALPAPLPSPIEPLGKGLRYYAVSVPALSPGLLYAVQGASKFGTGCDQVIDDYDSAGDFSTAP